MAVEENTLHRGYPLPHKDNYLQFDVERLRAAFGAVDANVQDLFDDVGELKDSRGQPEGIATLDEGGHVPASQLPSYVDDVLEFDTFADLPAEGEKGKIYVLLTPQATPQGSVSQYRWGGSAYVPVIASPGTTDNLAEGTSNLYHTAARVRAVALTGLSLANSAVVAATDTILSAIGKLQRQLNEKQSALVSGANIKTVNGKSLLGSGSLQTLSHHETFADLPPVGDETVMYLTWSDNSLYAWGDGGYHRVGGGGFEPKPLIDLGNVAVSGSETVDVDLSLGDFFVASMQTSNTSGTLTLNFTNIPDTAGKYLAWHVKVFRAGRKAVGYAPSVSWIGGVRPSRQSTSNSWDLWMFYVMDNGSIRACLVDTSAT